MKDIMKRIFGASTGLTEVGREDVMAALADSWKGAGVPQRQYEECTRLELENYRRGLPVKPYDVLVDILRDNIDGLDGKTILEVGCSSGYYSEVLRIKGINAEYHGCDYSGAFIDLAKKLYQSVNFRVQDACAMSYPDGSFDIAISGCCLLHIMDYEKAIRETARVAREYVVFHRTPVLHTKKTSYYIKTAYGVKMFEIHFNERELLRLMAAAGLRVVDIITFDPHFEKGSGDLCTFKTYLCRKG